MAKNIFTASIKKSVSKIGFEELFKIFSELILLTSGNVNEALSWLSNLDRKYNLTSDEYGIGDFINDLKEKGFIEEKKGAENSLSITPKSEHYLRKKALEEIFSKLKKSKKGNHSIAAYGKGYDIINDTKPFEFGDPYEDICYTESLVNAQINHGIQNFFITEKDLQVFQKESCFQTSTVLMIDISHSMVLYGEDRITPAKKTAMAFAELIKAKYPRDTLDIVVFGDDAWSIQIKDLPYLTVGPYYTNTVAGLERAIEILRRKKATNKQIFMITDGKPSCLKIGTNYYKNSFGLDKKIVGKTLALAHRCRRLGITITTYMVAKDPYLREFVREFTRANHGLAYFCDPNNVGSVLLEDYKRSKKKFFNH